MRGGGGVSWVVDVLFSQDKVLQRCVEQIIDDIGPGQGFNSASWSRTAWRGSGGAVLRRDHVTRTARIGNPEHYFYEPVAVTLALVFMRQSTKAFGRISCGFLREGALRP